MKKKMSIVLTGMILIAFMVINVQSSIKEYDSSGLSLNVLANIAQASDGEAGCYWTYERKFLSNNIHFIKCSDCSTQKADKIKDPGNCNFGGW